MFLLRKLSAFVLACLASAAAFAEGVTLPTVLGAGVGVEDYVTASITALGGVIAVCVGGYFAFLLVRKGIRWAGRMLG